MMNTENQITDEEIIEEEEIEETDEFYLKRYGMTMAQFNEKYPPLNDSEFMQLYVGAKKYVDNSFRS